MSRIGFVSCVSKKLPHAAPAEELYTSPLFKKASAYVRAHCDRWFILSAKHGLLLPSTVIEPYDVTLNKMPAADRRQWAERVLPDIYANCDKGDTLIFLAGQKYRQYLIPALQEKVYKKEVPMYGLSIGKQLQWLGENL